MKSVSPKRRRIYRTHSETFVYIKYKREFKDMFRSGSLKRGSDYERMYGREVEEDALKSLLHPEGMASLVYARAYFQAKADVRGSKTAQMYADRAKRKIEQMKVQRQKK